jgi:hypothetical protein
MFGIVMGPNFAADTYGCGNSRKKNKIFLGGTTTRDSAWMTDEDPSERSYGESGGLAPQEEGIGRHTCMYFTLAEATEHAGFSSQFFVYNDLESGVDRFFSCCVEQLYSIAKDYPGKLFQVVNIERPCRLYFDAIYPDDGSLNLLRDALNDYLEIAFGVIPQAKELIVRQGQQVRCVQPEITFDNVQVSAASFMFEFDAYLKKVGRVKNIRFKDDVYTANYQWPIEPGLVGCDKGIFCVSPRTGYRLISIYQGTAKRRWVQGAREMNPEGRFFVPARDAVDYSVAGSIAFWTPEGNTGTRYLEDTCIVMSHDRGIIVASKLVDEEVVYCPTCRRYSCKAVVDYDLMAHYNYTVCRHCGEKTVFNMTIVRVRKER